MMLYEGKDERAAAKMRFVLYAPPKTSIGRGRRGISSSRAEDILREVASEGVEWGV